jgi:glutaredoxin 3
MAKKVIIYSTPTCPYCQQAKDYFDEKKIKYTEHNVAEDEKARQEMIDKSDQMGVPVIIIDKKVIVGFDKPAIEKALN